jgi:hypothetical protein
MSTLPAVDDPRFIPAVDMLRRIGADEFQIRYSDDTQPVVWVAAVRFSPGKAAVNTDTGQMATLNHEYWECAAALSPLSAVFRLCDLLIDGGRCAHCHQRAGFDAEPGPPPLGGELICWYRFDPELETFRRSCEGVAP